MIPKTRTWGNVKVGSYIRDKDGVTWKVEQHKPGYWGVKSRAGDTKILDVAALGITDESPVDIMYLDESEVLTILRDEMGAELTSVKYDGEGVLYCPPFDEKDIGSMKYHLLIFHGCPSKSVNDPGNSAGMNTKKQLIEAHDALTAEPGRLWTPHIHTDASDRMKEFSWE